MRIIVTRVQPQAQTWVNSFESRGHEALAMPLIQIAPVAHVAAVVAAWRRWSAYVGVMFVSAHAVQHFFALKPALAHDLYAHEAINTRAWVTGPGSLAALRKQGVSANLMDAPAPELGQFDSEALWQQVHTLVQPGSRVLIVRGDTPGTQGQALSEGSDEASTGVGRDWFAQQVLAAGGQVEFVVAYQRSAPIWSEQDHILANRAASDDSVWVFSSTEALSNLEALMPGQDWHRARAVATHPRIALAANNLGFGVVRVASPTLPAVLSSIESLL